VRQKGVGMIWRRALAGMAALALVAAIHISLPPDWLTAAVAAQPQSTSVPNSGQPTDLAILAMYCAEAPAADALTSFFTSGATPKGCAPAVGVAIAVEENGTLLPGSPFATAVTGA